MSDPVYPTSYVRPYVEHHFQCVRARSADGTFLSGDVLSSVMKDPSLLYRVERFTNDALECDEQSPRPGPTQGALTLDDRRAQTRRQIMGDVTRAAAHHLKLLLDEDGSVFYRKYYPIAAGKGPAYWKARHDCTPVELRAIAQRRRVTSKSYAIEARVLRILAEETERLGLNTAQDEAEAAAIARLERMQDEERGAA